MTGADARQAAVRALLQIDTAGGYSNVVLDNLLENVSLSSADRALASRLVYGVVERRLTLDYLITACSSVPLKKMHPIVREILRCGVYQLVYMEKVPPAAAVNESVKLTRVMKQHAAAGFVNGLLRGVDRKKAELLDGLPDTDEGLEIRYSCPRQLIVLWREAYGEETACQLLEHLNDVPDACLRVNTLATSVEAFTDRLREAGIGYREESGLPGCLHLKSAVSLRGLAPEAENWYYHQDAASQWCCLALGARPGEHIADVCAAPGGKSLTLAQYMENQGEILACDLYPAKCETMEKRAARLGITCLRTAVRDASKPPPASLRGAFDRVLCDVPCSGLGVIRRKPEIRYKPLTEFDGLPALQYAILEQAALLVKPGGVLQYSTCTLRPQENEQVVERFLREHPEFGPRRLPLGCLNGGISPSSLTLFPHMHGTDGFFIAGFCKTG